MKFCKKCGIETEQKKRGECKPCNNISAAAYRAANTEKMRAATAKWRAANPEKSRAAGAAWHKANHDRDRANASAWKAANKDKILAYNAANIDKIRAASVAWSAANPEKLKIYTQNRRALKRAAGGKLSHGLSERLFKLQRGLCPCCNQPLGDDFHLDHIMPLSLGGSNTDQNMQLLRQRCNNQKHAKHPINFMQSRGFLI